MVFAHEEQQKTSNPSQFKIASKFRHTLAFYQYFKTR